MGIYGVFHCSCFHAKLLGLHTDSSSITDYSLGSSPCELKSHWGLCAFLQLGSWWPMLRVGCSAFISHTPFLGEIQGQEQLLVLCKPMWDFQLPSPSASMSVLSVCLLSKFSLKIYPEYASLLNILISLSGRSSSCLLDNFFNGYGL